MPSEGGSAGIILGDRYQVVGELGKGAMGIVYKAIDTLLHRTVAIKILPQQLAASVEFVARFRREAGALALLEHENIVGFYGFDSHPEGHFLVMECVDGENLGAVLAHRGPLAPAEAASIAADIASALSVGHHYQIVHRDIKPDNVLIEKGTGKVKVSDFGIAAVPDSRLTETGLTMGTLKYLAPEQIRGARVTPATDIYALGVVLYEMLAGRPPFLGDEPAALFHQHLNDDPPPLGRVAPQPIPRELAKIVVCALQKQPQRRFASAEAMAQALRDFCTRTTRPRQLLRRVVIIAGACALAALCTLGAVKVAPEIIRWIRSEERVVVQDRQVSVEGAQLSEETEADGGNGDRNEGSEVQSELVDEEGGLFAAAMAEMKKGNHAAAMTGFREFLAANPGADHAAEARYLIGKCLGDQRDYETAIGEFDKVATNHPGSRFVPSALLGIAECHVALGRWDRAEEVLGELIHDHPRSPEASTARSKLADRAAAVLAEAEREMQRGDYGKALNGFRDYLVRSPSSDRAGEIHYRMGRCYYEQEDCGNAIREFEQAKTVRPGGSFVPAALLATARCQHKLGKPEGKQTLRDLVDRFPQSEEAAEARAMLGPSSQDFLESARRARERGDHAGARETLREFLTKNPDSEEAVMARGSIVESYYEERNHQKVIEEAQEMLHDYPAAEWIPPYAHCRIGRSYYEQGNHEAAIRECEQVLEHPDSEWIVEARLILGYTYYDLGRYESAIPHLEGVVNDPGSSYAEAAQYKLGWCHNKLGDYDRAIGEFRKVLERFGGKQRGPDAMLGIANSYAKKGDREGARSTLQDLVSRYPNSPAAEEAKKALQEMR